MIDNIHQIKVSSKQIFYLKNLGGMPSVQQMALQQVFIDLFAEGAQDAHEDFSIIVTEVL